MVLTSFYSKSTAVPGPPLTHCVIPSQSLCVSLCVCVRVGWCVCGCACMHLCVCVCVGASAGARVFVCMCVCVRVCVFVFLGVCTSIWCLLYVNVCVPVLGGDAGTLHPICVQATGVKVSRWQTTAAFVPFVNRLFEWWSCLTYFCVILYILLCYCARLPCSVVLKFNKTKDIEKALCYRLDIHTPIDQQLHSPFHSHVHS